MSIGYGFDSAMLDIAQCDLAEFDNPPVVETVLSVQFDQLATMKLVQFGLFWKRVRDQFPETQQHPALLPVFEQVKAPTPTGIQLRFEAQQTSRVWLLNNNGAEMMQIQNDRFIKNWRKGDRDQEYPRYKGVIKPAFERDFREFETFLSEENLGAAKINQCEVTYVNHIVAGEGWNNWSEFEKIFTFGRMLTTSSYPGVADDYGFAARFPILGPGGEWIGRLHLSVEPAFRVSDKKPMYAMNLTARGMFGSRFDFFDIGRRCIVKSFENLTTDHMHKIWGKK